MSGGIENQVTKFEIASTKLYVPVVTLSTQENVKLLDQFKSSGTRTINWDQYQSKILTERQNQNLDY